MGTLAPILPDVAGRRARGRAAGPRPALLAAAFVPFVMGACAAAPGRPAEARDPRIATVEAFLAARERGDVEAARALLGEDPRVRFGEDDEEGSPWGLEGGPWRAWDEHFRGETVRTTPWRVAGGRVQADMRETNDYFRLTESTGSVWRAVYSFDGDGRIAELLLAPVPGAASDRGRRDEFEAWARRHRPGEAEVLMPGGSLDPSGDRPERMRALLEEWRAAVGLPPIR